MAARRKKADRAAEKAAEELRRKCDDLSNRMETDVCFLRELGDSRAAAAALAAGVKVWVREHYSTDEDPLCEEYAGEGAPEDGRYGRSGYAFTVNEYETENDYRILTVAVTDDGAPARLSAAMAPFWRREAEEKYLHALKAALSAGVSPGRLHELVDQHVVREVIQS